MLLQAGGFASGPPVLTVSTLVDTGTDAGIASVAPTPTSMGLGTAIDGDMGGCAEADRLAGSHQPFSTLHGCYNTLNCVIT